jgi:hypothetical protein
MPYLKNKIMDNKRIRTLLVEMSDRDTIWRVNQDL